VKLSWDVPPGTDGFTYQVERRTGGDGGFSRVASLDQKNLTLRRQTPGTYAYRISASDEDGNTVAGKQTTDVRIDFDGPVYALGPYPNPAQNVTSFDLTAQSGQSVTIGIYDVTGKRVYSETRRVEAQSPESITFDTQGWSSGMYFLRIRGEGFVQTRKMIVVQ
jgi:hypothetical protein